MKKIKLLSSFLMMFFVCSGITQNNTSYTSNSKETLIKENIKALFSVCLSCQTDEDCPAGMICFEGECVEDGIVHQFCLQDIVNFCNTQNDSYCYWYIPSSGGTWLCIF
ncbi:MAG: hypothetical protein Q8S04_04005 [Bacteroidales bacterium]|nr:hypothetical protein [Bacteroidales bacterium]